MNRWNFLFPGAQAAEPSPCSPSSSLLSSLAEPNAMPTSAYPASQPASQPARQAASQPASHPPAKVCFLLCFRVKRLALYSSDFFKSAKHVSWSRVVRNGEQARENDLYSLAHKARIYGKGSFLLRPILPYIGGGDNVSTQECCILGEQS